ncbi:MAG: aminotransferase class I/II-fold pyridoxal phosphate-dependent enzyme [Thaumarchaeota archaeon]|nr:aminotransferase class I/II-fold pyridoxal phosphate-dependent enzyme [Nitrososphaerota archaeon]MBI3642213.1 aminotransferase class I/II-fold pyridoxal phosphate-dependent enzyme [Nitrososphaerota archaeon]
MKHKFDFVNETLEKIKTRNLYRKLQDIRVQGPYIIFKKKKLVNLCSNDYLGLGNDKISNMQLQSSSRLVAGNDISFNILEKKLALHKSQESALIFPTGYMANLGSIPPLTQKGDLILSDELNHASIIDACRLSGAKIVVYKHNDVADLDKKIRQKADRKFIVTEGIFSMNGDFAELKKISEIASKNNATLVLDDAHGDFVTGHDGRGSAEHFGVTKKIDVYVSSLSKGLGAFGGYVASRTEIRDLIINTSRPFIYTSALPSFLVELALQRFSSKREKHRKKLWNNIKMMQKGLDSIGYTFNSSSHIIPIIIGSEKKVMEFGKYLFDNDIFAQPIRYPTVSLGSARIRISVTALLAEEHIEKSIDVFESAGKKFGIL